MAVTNGGPAFPFTEHEQYSIGASDFEREVQHPGMTLRDYFAAQALSGWLADGAMQRICEAHPELTRTANMPSLAGACYEFADAMLAARDKAAK